MNYFTSGIKKTNLEDIDYLSVRVASVENIKVDNEKSTEKIDGAAAIFMA